ncbi:MAG: Rrf2 family transcriptional regulator [Spirochaetaceae bacterium]|jgi:Rrf2 family protein|nr:Rrf2 family transcriptional regulator [Spirochaetaceae bacterium]
MRISTKGRYSLEALLYMAMLPAGTYSSTKSISEHTGISDGYLEQLFIPLRKAGIVKGVRGPQGGYMPAKEAGAISVGDILRAVEGPMELVDCIRSTRCPAQDDCVSRHTWRELYEAVNCFIDSVSLENLSEAYRGLDYQDYTI